MELKIKQFKSKSAPEGCTSDSNIVLIQDLHEYPQKANPQSCSCTQSLSHSFLLHRSHTHLTTRKHQQCIQVITLSLQQLPVNGEKRSSDPGF